MGNRTERGGHPPVINPSDNPYLHVIRVNNSYEYVANLQGVRLRFGTRSKGAKGFEITAKSNLSIPLLDPVQHNPPREIATQETLEMRIAESEQQILERITPEIDIIACSHGSYWDLLPERHVARLLQESGYSVADFFPRTGGRKRIQEYAVLFDRNR